MSNSEIHEKLVKAGFYRDRFPQDRAVDWDENRRRIASRQLALNDMGIDAGPVDGLAGPQTLHAVEVFNHFCDTGRIDPDWRKEATGKPFVKPGRRRSVFPTYANAVSFYGMPGPAVEAQLIYITPPFPLYTSWSRERMKLRLHRRCADSATAALKDIHAHYGTSAIKHLRLDLCGGSYVHRPMRGGDKFSTHAFGAAIDFDPERNMLRWDHTKAAFAAAEYERFFEIWESHGWRSLGRERDFDWMHVQAVEI